MTDAALRDYANIMPYITAENAKELSRKAHEARWHSPKPESVPKPSLEQINGNALHGAFPEWNGIADARAKEVIELLQEQIALTKTALQAKMEPRDRAQLLGALDRLLERERVWSQRPAAKSIVPGANKPRRPAAQSLDSDPVPPPTTQ